MSEEPRVFEPPPEPASDLHEARVEQVRDVTRDRTIVLPASPNSDMGWRQAFPVTYDIPVDPPADQVDTSQEK